METDQDNNSIFERAMNGMNDSIVRLNESNIEHNVLDPEKARIIILSTVPGLFFMLARAGDVTHE